MNKTNLLLVDWCNLVYRVSYQLSDLSEGAVYFGIFRSLIAVSKKYPNYQLVLCLDSEPRERKALYPEYKAQRSSHPGDIGTVVSAIQPDYFLPIASIAYKDGAESDDCIASLALEWASECGGSSIIYSNDDDFAQLLSDKIRLYKPSLDGLVSDDYVQKKYGVPPERLVWYRIVRGDVSDNVKGIPRFPSKLIVAKVQSSRDIEEFITDSQYLPPKWAEVWKANEGVLRRNLKLMQLGRIDDVQVINSTRDLKALETTFRAWEMQSIIPKLSELKQQFSLL